MKPYLPYLDCSRCITQCGAIALLAGVFALSGCAPIVHTATQDSAHLYSAAPPSVVNHDHTFSATTRETLRIARVSKSQAINDPTGAIHALASLRGKGNARHLAIAEVALRAARQEPAKWPRRTAGFGLCAAEQSYHVLGRLGMPSANSTHPDAQLARALYNNATALVVRAVESLVRPSGPTDYSPVRSEEAYRQAKLDQRIDRAGRELRADEITGSASRQDRALAQREMRRTTKLPVRKKGVWHKRYVVPGPLGRYVLSLNTGRSDLFAPDTDYLFPAEDLRIYGLPHRNRRAGYGAPLVVAHHATPFAGRRYPTSSATELLPFRNVTATIAFSGSSGTRNASLHLNDATARHATATLNGRNVALAADYSTAAALYYDTINPEYYFLSALFAPEDFEHRIGLYTFEPVRTDKIPVVLVHGLNDTHESWKTVVNGLRDDPLIRENYQFWIFFYPNGIPLGQSAPLLRRYLEQAVRDAGHPPLFNRMVLVGHSMGGIVSRLQVTKARSSSLLATPNLDLHKPAPFVSRVILAAVPHRGADVAMLDIVTFFNSFIKRPLHLGGNTLEFLTTIGASQTSLESLRPDGPILTSMNRDAAIAVPHHSIIARNDPFVPYKSSKLAEGGYNQGTLMVPGGHSAHRRPEAIEYIAKILREHYERRSSK